MISHSEKMTDTELLDSFTNCMDVSDYTALSRELWRRLKIRTGNLPDSPVKIARPRVYPEDQLELIPEIGGAA